MRPIVFTSFLAVIIVTATVGLRAPASANVTNISLSANQTQNLVCPTTIQVTVKVTGNPNQPFSAQMLGTFNGSVTSLVGPTNGTIPASGVAIGAPTVNIPVLTGTGNKIDFAASQNGQLPVLQTLPISCVPPPTAAPPGTYTGTVTSLTTSASSVMQGESVRLTVNGTGTCSIQLSGLDGLPGVPQTISPGKMPLNFDIKMNKVGTFNAGAVVLGLAGAPGNCNATGPISSVFTKIVVAPPPTTAPPSIVKVEPEWPNGSAYRPENYIAYTGEHIDLAITGSQDNAATDAANRCMYQVTVKDLDAPSRGTIYSSTFAHFAPLDLGALAPAGLYQIDVAPPTVNDGFYLPECGGHASTNVRVLPPIGWITGMDLVGFAFHFNAGDDMAMPQFCDACTSIFSPAHNRSFLGVHPHTDGLTQTPNSQGTCVYNITAARGSDVRGGEAQYINGQPGTPKKFIAFTGAIGNPESPYWYMYNDDSDTVTVTITEGHDQLFPSCFIVGGKISKTIHFTQNLNLPPVHV
jgi:hypothetical protein